MDFAEELENEKNGLARTRVDPEKFFFFYEKYYHRVLGFMYRFTSDQHLAEDLTSETFLVAQQKLWQFRWQKATFGGWLYKIASNEATQHFRRANIWTTTENAAGESVVESVEPDLGALAQLIVKEDLCIILAEIERWKDVNRTIFMLRFWQGMSIPEIADHMRISNGTVKTIISRGRKVLRKALERKNRDRHAFAIGKQTEAFLEGELTRFSDDDNDLDDVGVEA